MGETQVICFQVEKTVADLIDEQAKRGFRTRSDQLRLMINDWIMDRAAKLVDPGVGYETGTPEAGDGNTSVS